MDRPARVQIEKSTLNELATERALNRQQQQLPSAVFNTWYGKWAGGDKQVTKFRSPFRCDVDRDAGYTKAKGPPFCLWFARGACYKGSECTALHRVPTKDDVRLAGPATDCFGRVKHGSYRDDMAGVGSLFDENRTLFVGYFDSTHGRKLADTVRRQFVEWGPIDRVRPGKNGSIAFVTYEMELSAQFAKEAMSNQTLTGSETLVVRWARDSPAPVHLEEEKIRKIVRTVLRDRRAEAVIKKRPPPSEDVEPNGILSREAAVTLREKKRRVNKSETPSKLPDDNTAEDGNETKVSSGGSVIYDVERFNATENVQTPRRENLHNEVQNISRETSPPLNDRAVLVSTRPSEPMASTDGAGTKPSSVQPARRRGGLVDYD